MFNKVEICGVNTARLKLLTDDEKQELLIRCAAGDKLAREELINGNLRLVLSVIQRFVSRCDDPDDLFQVGCVGLIKAVDNFDVSQNVKFSTYAVPMVIECRNPRKDFESYDQKNRIITGNFATLRRPKEYRDLR
ncbi:MAG: sigma-70 family RNA polymerase sigma factor, partial [Ruminococcaceae bacterium]|nr:sigma-70 family RNA polymerase sigma factor [Oscillospiraceae bacterium]